MLDCQNVNHQDWGLLGICSKMFDQFAAKLNGKRNYIQRVSPSDKVQRSFSFRMSPVIMLYYQA